MIPVLIVPVVSRFDLLPRLLGSIDHPVERTVIVDNSCSGLAWEGAEVIRPIMGLGYPGGINAGIMQTPCAPWWLFASIDVVFGLGDLAAVAKVMATGSEACVVTGDRGDGRLLRWAYGALNRAAVDEVGLMDEHAFFPIYFDDDDYQRRCVLADVDWITYNGTIRHGDDGGSGSTTIKSDESARAANQRTYPQNMQRYVDKWGGLPGQERFTTPYGLPVPLSFVKPDMLARAERLW